LRLGWQRPSDLRCLQRRIQTQSGAVFRVPSGRKESVRKSYPPGHHYDNTKRQIDGSVRVDADKAKIFADNAQRVYGRLKV
jgi:hypothetical protein